MKSARFRHNVSISIAGLVAFLGAVPLATSGFGGGNGTPAWAYPLLLILLIPIFMMLWGWRTGTDAGPDGLRLKAVFGSRRLAWDQINAFVPRGRQVVAVLRDGGSIVLPAVSKGDLPRLVAASGNALPQPDDASGAKGGTDGDSGANGGTDGAKSGTDSESGAKGGTDADAGSDDAGNSAIGDTNAGARQEQSAQ